MHGLSRGVSTDAMRVLITRGADVRTQNVGGKTPLRRAAEMGNVDIVACLLEHPDVNVNALDARGRTALAGAVEHGQLAIVDMLLRAPGINVDTRLFPRRCTVLFYAASHPGPNAQVMVNHLLDSGAHVNAQDFYGQTPLMQAIRYGRQDIADIFRQRGADDRVENMLGYSAQQMAAVAHTLFIQNMFLDDSAHRMPGFRVGAEQG